MRVKAKKCQYSNGEKLIWDSGYGFDFCEYLDDCPLEEKAAVRLTSGVMEGKVVLVSYDQLCLMESEKGQECLTKYEI